MAAALSFGGRFACARHHHRAEILERLGGRLCLREPAGLDLIGVACGRQRRRTPGRSSPAPVIDRIVGHHRVVRGHRRVAVVMLSVAAVLSPLPAQAASARAGTRPRAIDCLFMRGPPLAAPTSKRLACSIRDRHSHCDRARAGCSRGSCPNRASSTIRSRGSSTGRVMVSAVRRDVSARRAVRDRRRAARFMCRNSRRTADEPEREESGGR